MENSVTAAPLLVRKGVTYTKLAVMQTGVGEERRGAVLHLGTGEGRRSRGNEQGEDIKDRKYEINWLSKIMQMKKVKNFLIQDKIYCSPSMFVCVCCRPWGTPPGGSSGPECHLTAGDSSVHLTGACQQYIIAPGRAFAHLFTHTYCTNAQTCIHQSAVPINVSPCVSRARLWWAALCLWLESRLKAALCIPAVRCVPEPEAWAVNGAQRKKPAGPQQQSEYCRNITMMWKTSRNEKQRQTAALLG